MEYFHGIAAGLAAASDRTAKYKVGVYCSGAVCEADETSWAGAIQLVIKSYILGWLARL